jgi:hypothetical protein
MARGWASIGVSKIGVFKIGGSKIGVSGRQGDSEFFV